jgi:hypothetical protein
VIVAHQLLKNDIPQHEYWLVTHDLDRQPAELTQWMQWHASAKETESGEIRFSYTQLGFDHGIGHFMLFVVDSAAQVPAPLRPKSPQTSSAASDRKSAPQPWFRQAG